MSKKEERRQNILDAALTLFIQKGIHPTTTAEISKYAGIAAGTLFNYFKTKEDLINILYLEVKKDMAKTFEQGLDFDTDFDKFFRQYWMIVIDWGIINYQKVQFLKQMEESPFIPESLKKEIDIMFEPFFNSIQTAIGQNFLKDLPLNFSIAVTYQTLLTAIDYIINNQNNPDFNKETFLEKAFDAYYHGMRNN